MGIRTIAIAGSCAAFMVGCTVRIPDIEHNEPVFTGRYAGHYQSFSACLVSEWDKSYHNNQQVLDAANQVAVLRGSWKDWGLEWDPTLTTITQVDDGTVLVEFRQHPRRREVPEWIVPGFETCAKRPASSAQ